MKLSCRFWGAVPSGSGRVAQAVPSGPVTPKSALRLSSFLGRPAWKMCKKNQESTFLFGCHSDVWVQREHLRLRQNPRILNFTSQKFKTWTNEGLHKRQKNRQRSLHDAFYGLIDMRTLLFSQFLLCLGFAETLRNMKPSNPISFVGFSNSEPWQKSTTG